MARRKLPMDEWQRSLALEKARRDVLALQTLARYVLILDDKARTVRLIDNSGDYSANVFAVLAPASVAGTPLEQAVIFELGISETRPYNGVSRKNSEGECLRATRRKVRDPNDREVCEIWRHLSDIVPKLVEERRSRWKRRGGRWFIDRETQRRLIFAQGRRFSASAHDRWFVTRLLNLEWEYLWDRYLGSRVRWTKKYLRKYVLAWRPCYATRVRKNGTVIPGRIPRRSTNLIKVLEIIGSIRFWSRFVTWRFLTSLGNREALVRNALDVIGVSLAEERYEIRRLPGFPGLNILTIRRSLDTDFLVFEAFPNTLFSDHDPSLAEKPDDDEFPDSPGTAFYDDEIPF